MAGDKAAAPKATRQVDCPHCRDHLRIPATTPAGTRARCGACGNVFRVPEEASTATGVSILELPPELREKPSSEVKRPLTPVPEVRPTMSASDAARKAFDLDEKNAPVRRTGAHHVDVRELLSRMDGEKSD